MYAEVHETPPEIVDIQALISFGVHSFEYFGEGFQAVERPHSDLGLEILQQIFQIELLKVIDWLVVLSVRCRLDDEHVLVLLVLAGNVGGQSALILHFQVLGLVVCGVVVTVDLVLRAELVLVFHCAVRSEED